METKFIVNTLSSALVSFINIKDCPFLVSTTIVTIDSYGSTFLIFASFNIKDFTGLPVDELVVLIFENLPPS
jgi:hypothetical protein